MIAPGTYSAVVVPQTDGGVELAARFGESNKKGTPFVLVAFEILSGPFAGQRISWFGYFTDATIDRTIESLRACGFTGDDLAAMGAQRPDIEVQIVVEHEEYEGKKRAKVQWVNAASRGINIEKPMDAKALGLFSARFKSKLKTIPVVEGKKAERQAPTAPPAGEDLGDDPMTDMRGSGPPVGGDDDIPF
jgi:hypothetical protein